MTDKPAKVKITVRIGEPYLSFIKKDAKDRDLSLTEAATILLQTGVFYAQQEDAEDAAAAREKRKRDGYLKRSLNRYGSYYKLDK